MTINGQGAQVYQALADNESGTTITAVGSEGAVTADGKWKLIYNSVSTTRAGRRWYADRSREVWAIWGAAMAAAGRRRTLHVIAWQAALGFGSAARDSTGKIPIRAPTASRSRLIGAVALPARPQTRGRQT
ncbi:hypothetical protein NED98_08730 [Sphingomonas sp. MMSM20]|uniref:hypothetical protein n=1 Tax=Sphingomonas lycopersici TaxID=2951807 RepID=UPI002237DE39|nr:hypothetical protein [Sphingomonas lycopersici]MCW6530328.1 hypothetical protein [Sphingomonas lycopersici]